jgi:hypothetical protein
MPDINQMETMVDKPDKSEIRGRCMPGTADNGQPGIRRYPVLTRGPALQYLYLMIASPAEGSKIACSDRTRVHPETGKFGRDSAGKKNSCRPMVDIPGMHLSRNAASGLIGPLWIGTN